MANGIAEALKERKVIWFLRSLGLEITSKNKEALYDVTLGETF
jgi:hypothetical protein